MWVNHDDRNKPLPKGTNKHCSGLMALQWKVSSQEKAHVFTDWLKKECKRVNKKNTTLDNKIYARFIQTFVKKTCERI